MIREEGDVIFTDSVETAPGTELQETELSSTSEFTEQVSGRKSMGGRDLLSNVTDAADQARATRPDLSAASDDDEPAFTLQKVQDSTESYIAWYNALPPREQSIVDRLALFHGRLESLTLFKDELYSNLGLQQEREMQDKADEEKM